MLDLARDIIGSQPILTAFLAIGVGYLVGQINIFGFSLGVGAVLFVGPRHRCVRAESPDHRSDRPHRPDHVPLRHRNSLRPAVLRGHDRRGAEIQSSRPDRLPRRPRRGAPLGQMFNIKIGHTLGLYAGSMTSTATLQAALDVTKSKDPVDRLLDRLSFRRDWTDPLHLFHDAAREAEISGQGRSAFTWARFLSARLCRPYA